MAENMNNWTWAYWQGPRFPLIDICLTSIERQNAPNSRILGPEDMNDEVRSLTASLGPHLTADVFRMWWVKKHGGQWMDADSLCVSPFKAYEDLEEYDFVGFGFAKKKRHVSNGYFASRQNGIIINKVWELIKEKRSRNVKKWTSMGQGILGPLYQEYQNSGLFKRHEHWKVLSMSWRNQKKYLEENKDYSRMRIWKPNKKYCYHVGNVISKKFKDYTREQLLSMDNFLGFVLRETVKRMS